MCRVFEHTRRVEHVDEQKMRRREEKKENEPPKKRLVSKNKTAVAVFAFPPVSVRGKDGRERWRRRVRNVRTCQRFVFFFPRCAKRGERGRSKEARNGSGSIAGALSILKVLELEKKPKKCGGGKHPQNGSVQISNTRVSYLHTRGAWNMWTNKK